MVHVVFNCCLCSFLDGLVNTLRPTQNDRHFADDTFNRLSVNENVRISIKFSLKFVPKGQINNIPAIFQATSHYLNQWWLVYWRIYASLGLNELRIWCNFVWNTSISQSMLLPLTHWDMYEMVWWYFTNDILENIQWFRLQNVIRHSFRILTQI